MQQTALTYMHRADALTGAYFLSNSLPENMDIQVFLRIISVSSHELAIVSRIFLREKEIASNQLNNSNYCVIHVTIIANKIKYLGEEVPSRSLSLPTYWDSSSSLYLCTCR